MLTSKRRFVAAAVLAGVMSASSWTVGAASENAARNPTLAGYVWTVAHAKPGITVSATFTIPTVTCSPGQNALIQIGPQVDGTTGDAALIFDQAGCDQGNVFQRLNQKLPGVPFDPVGDFNLLAGHVVTMTVTMTPDSSIVTYQENGGGLISFMGDGDPPNNVYVGLVGTSTNLPGFGSVAYSNVTINSRPLKPRRHVVRTVMVNGAQVVVKTSRVTGGVNFSLTQI
jgi:Peptidase A4 family